MAQRILVIDDSRAALAGIRSVIETNAEWEVCGEAMNPVDGIAKASELKPDLIIMDLHMQELDGFQATTEILRKRPTIPIILFSVFGTAGIVPGALKAGIRRVVAKEDGGEALAAAIREVLRK